MQFDAAIDLTPAIAGKLGPGDAVRLAGDAVRSLPGAGWIDVEWCGGAPGNLAWMRLYQPGRSQPQVGGDWDTLARLVEEAVVAALE